MSAGIISVRVRGVPALRAALKREASVAGPLTRRAAVRVQEIVIRHLQNRNARPSRPGWPKSNYWDKAANSVRIAAQQNRATITIGNKDTPGLGLRYYGGVVRPKAGKKALAIPMRPEVADIWPREYDQKKLFLLVRKALGKAWLAKREKNGHLTILWRLVRQTRHQADPSVLPTDAALADAVEKAVRNALRGLSAGGSAP